MAELKWEKYKLKYLFNIKNGGTPKSSEPTYWEPEEVVWITPEDLSKGKSYIDNSIRRISYTGLKNSSANIIKPGSIVLSTRAPIGNIKIVKTPYATNQGCKSLEKNDKTDIRFFYYYLSINKDYLNQLGRGTTFLELSNEALKNVELAVPKMQEQKNISDYLDKKTSQIDSLISEKESLIELLEEKRQAVITETVTKGLDPDVKMKDSGIEWIGEVPEHWELVKLKRFISVMNGKEIDVEKEIGDLDAIDVFGSGGVFKKTDKFIFEGESVLFGRKGTIGKPIYVNQAFWTVDTMYYTKFYEDAFPKWFYYLLSVFPWGIHTTNTALPSLVGTDLENNLCAIPSYNEQLDIARYLDKKTFQINDAIFNIKEQISKLKEYRESLIYEAVTGKIDVRDYVTETEKVN